MANIKSAIKDIRKTRRRHERKVKAVSGLREAYRKALKAVSAKSADGAGGVPAHGQPTARRNAGVRPPPPIV